MQISSPVRLIVEERKAVIAAHRNFNTMTRETRMEASKSIRGHGRLFDILFARNNLPYRFRLGRVSSRWCERDEANGRCAREREKEKQVYANSIYIIYIFHQREKRLKFVWRIIKNAFLLLLKMEWNKGILNEKHNRKEK